MPVTRGAPLAICLVVALAFDTGCGSAAPSSQTTPARADAHSSGDARPATWEYRPRGVARPAFQLDLGERGRLAFDALGGRALITDERTQVGGVAPEPLTGAVERAGALHALGASGSVYVASALLEPWRRVAGAPRPLIGSGVVSSGEFLGLGADGQLWVSRDLGQRWQTDPAPLFFSALHVRGETALLQSLPESYFSWHAHAGLEQLPPTFGGGTFEIGPDGRSGLRAADGLHPLGSQPALSSREPLSREENFLRPSQVREGKGALSHSGAAVAFLPEEAGVFRLWAGAVDQALLPTKLSLPCEPKQTTLSDDYVYAVCENRRGGFDFFGSASGAPFRPLGGGLRGGQPLKLRASGRTLAFSGFCPPVENEPGCDARGLFWADFFGEGSVEVPIPEGRMPLDFQFAGDGSLWAIALGPRDQHLFAHRVMARELPPPSRSDGASREKSTIVSPYKAPPRFQVQSRDLTDLFHLSPSALKAVELFPADGSVMGLAIQSDEGTTTFALDSILNGLGFGKLQGALTSISGIGERLVALHEPSRKIFETEDGGLSWTRSDWPSLPGAREESVAAFCAMSGCLIGEELFRSGFGGDARDKVLRESEGSEGAESSGRALAPIECRVKDGTRHALEGVTSRPTAHDSARGDVFWSQVASRPKDGSTWVYHARFGERVIDRKELLARSSDASSLALAVSEQVEGAAALRFRVKSGRNSRLSFDQIEVAWDNRLTGDICHGSVPRELAGSGLDYENRPGGAAKAKPSLLTVSGDTLYVELASQSQGEGSLFAVDACGQNHRIITKTPWDGPELLTEREFVRDGKRDLLLRLSRDGFLVSSTGVDGSSRVMRLAGIPGRQDLVFSVHLGYLGKEARFTTVIADGDGRFWRGESLSIGELLAPTPPRPMRVPLLSDAHEPLRGCSSGERTGSVRVVSPAFPRGERSVTVTGLREPISLTVGRAVVQGSLERPCVSSLEALSGMPGVTMGPMETEYGVLMDLAPDGVSWLFEETKGIRARSVSALALDCSIRNAEAANLEDDSARGHEEGDPNEVP